MGVELVAVSSVFEPELLQLPFSCKREHLCVYCACVLYVCVVHVCVIVRVRAFACEGLLHAPACLLWLRHLSLRGYIW